jgi:outer membrane receptor protein involved in Fe transport
MKTTVLDGHLRINGDIFYSDYKDIQLSSLYNGLPLTQNAASGEAWGAELEVTGRFGGFGVNAGIGWLDATFAEAVIVNTSTTGRWYRRLGLVFSPGSRSAPVSAMRYPGQRPVPRPSGRTLMAARHALPEHTTIVPRETSGTRGDLERGEMAG